MNQNVFPYEVSGQKCFGDPFKIDRLITAHLGGDRKAAIERTRSPDPNIAAMGMEALLTAIAKAFGIQRFNEQTGEGELEDTLLAVFDSFLEWKVEQKKKCRILADLARVFGLAGVLSTHVTDDSPYAVLYGLWLNLKRLRCQAAKEFEMGYRAATTDQNLPRVWYDGIAPLEEEIEELRYKDSSARSDRRVMRRKGPF